MASGVNLLDFLNQTDFAFREFGVPSMRGGRNDATGLGAPTTGPEQDNRRAASL